jgi:dolichyl-diphosphooligosaccharide--protein glycosyltransferase
MYGMTSIYFAGVMVRLMLVLAPVMCILSGIGISSIFISFMKNIETNKQEKKTKKFDNNYPNKSEIATAVVFCLTFFLLTYTFHCTWVTSEAYSSPSIVLSARSHNGDKIIFDDFRESYYWFLV